LKLLNLGINLVFVIEGKQRIRDFNGNEADKFRKRRSGTAFWKACKDSQQMLELLGVPVVRARSEGEALCALLSQRGIVDGVISNDGDCLLFGAKTIYTKFSCENLDKGLVMRYDLENLRAVVQASDDTDIAESEVGTLKLSRYDLISFALLTGSDLVGNGLPKVGHKKAIRFIHKCQLDNPLSAETASLDEMKSWAKAATADAQPLDTKKGEKCCSRCTHAGSKRSHEKNGCEMCGTEPGEPCYAVTTEDRFRKSLRAKALAVQSKFDPSQVFSAYMRPNENQLPMQLMTASTNCVQMGNPKLNALLDMTLVVKGHILTESREFVRQTVTRFLSRKELLRNDAPAHDMPNTAHQRVCRERPVPQKIVKALTKDHVPCYQVAWLVNATVTDENGDGVDGYEYMTVEPRELVEQKYPALITAFREAEKERVKQGDGEQNRRRDFLESFLFQSDGEQAAEGGKNEKQKNNRKPGHVKKREEFFQNKPPLQDYRATARKRRRKAMMQNRGGGGDDVGNLLRFVSKPLKLSPAKTKFIDHSSIESFTEDGLMEKVKAKHDDERTFQPYPREQFQTPEFDEKALFVSMGGFEIEITPIESNRGAYPPKNIFVRATHKHIKL
jgi:flap endonuclease GEN